MNNKIIAKRLNKIAKELLSYQFPNQKALNKYLKQHPNAVRKNHIVVKNYPSHNPQEFLRAQKYKVKDEKELKEIINNSDVNADLNHLDVSDVTDMNSLFSFSDFNGDISEWDTSNVTDMFGMFYESKFNGDISEWDTSNVKNTSIMFSGSDFRGDISNWDVSKVENPYNMFIDSRQNKPTKQSLYKQTTNRRTKK